MRHLTWILSILSLSCTTPTPVVSREVPRRADVEVARVAEPEKPNIPEGLRSLCLEGDADKCWEIARSLDPDRQERRRRSSATLERLTSERLPTKRRVESSGLHDREREEQQALEREQERARRRALRRTIATSWYQRTHAARLRLCPQFRWHCKATRGFPKYALTLTPKRRSALDEEFKTHRDAMRAKCKAGDGPTCWRWSKTYWRDEVLSSARHTDLKLRALRLGSLAAWSDAAKLLTSSERPGISSKREEALRKYDARRIKKERSATNKRTISSLGLGGKRSEMLTSLGFGRYGREKLKRSCDKGDMSACYSHEWSMYYTEHSGLGLTLRGKDKLSGWRELHDTLQARCAKGKGRECWRAGYVAGKHLEDEALASKSYARGCQLGDGPACSRLALEKFSHDGFRAIPDALKRACSLKHSDACTILALMYATGQSVPRDLARALPLLQRVCRSKPKGSEACLMLRHLKTPRAKP